MVRGSDGRRWPWAALTPWLVQHSETWYQTLACGRCLPLLRSLPGGGKAPARCLFSQDNNHSGSRGIYSPRVTLGVYFGLINGGYASLIAWFPLSILRLVPARSTAVPCWHYDAWASSRGIADACYGSPSGRRKLLMLALALQLVGFCGFIGCRCNCRYCGQWCVD